MSRIFDRSQKEQPPVSLSGTSLIPQNGIARCEQEIERCRELSGDPNLPQSERVGAQLGELDWTIAKQMEEESSWNEVCPECHVHRGHRYTCSFARRQDSKDRGKDRGIEAYRAFLKAKCRVPQDLGVPVEPGEIHPWLKPHQAAGVEWAVRGGRRALFESFGLGKTAQQLEILRLVVKRVGGCALIVAPLGVRQEFKRDAENLNIDLKFVRSRAEIEDHRYQRTLLAEVDPKCTIYLTNYETVRDGKLDPSSFTAASLDEAAVLRSFGGTLTFREFMRLFEKVPYRFVATATPDPNEYIELLAYAAFLGIMTVSEGKTRFFKRDSTKADKLTLHPHKEEEFWLWVASWALFLYRPSDLGFSDDGYDLPPIEILHHEVAVDHRTGAAPERNGQSRMFREAMHGVVDAAREKRDTLDQRITKVRDILQGEPDKHFLLWHDLEVERKALEQIPGVVSVYGAEDLDEREQSIIEFSDGKIQHLAGKPVMLGSGPNFQYHCSDAIFCGIGFKFNEFIQAVHRIHRFLQPNKVRIHLIYAESEKRILDNLLAKWGRYNQQRDRMRELVQKYGLSQISMASALSRSIGVKRQEVCGKNYTLVLNDSVEEMHCDREGNLGPTAEEVRKLESSSVGLILTSIPFSTQYEYTPSYNDFGHTDSNEHFWEQMDFLIPELMRVLKPGRIAAIHVKDRIVPGGITGLGFQTVYPFHMDAIAHFTAAGLGYLGMKTIVTDVVRENNQTYRLGWTEQCKDGSKMGVGMPEYLLLFRKPPTESENAYADEPVVKSKKRYTRSRWQIDAHGFMRSNGNRPLIPEDLEGLPHHAIFKLFRAYSETQVYDFEQHVKLAEALEEKGILPVTFMLLQPQSWHPDVWTDITRMRTLNVAQSAKGREMHVCPMQFDIADRVIEQMSMPGELVLDPFVGLGTVVMEAVKANRKGYGIELNSRYWLDAVSYCKLAEESLASPTLFDLEKEAWDSKGQETHAGVVPFVHSSQTQKFE